MGVGISVSLLRGLCARLDTELADVVSQGIARQPDSRAVGAHTEKAVVETWPRTCERLEVEAMPRPGRRTIYDAAFRVDGYLVGVDVRTKDLSEGRYADGGICSVGNLLRLMTEHEGTLLVAEFGYRDAGGEAVFEYAKSAPLHCLPLEAFRIENLGTGQVRLDTSVGQLSVNWKQSEPEFLQGFAELAIAHYGRVAQVAASRAEALRHFQQTGDLRLR